jgi:hypothetical protein
MLMKLKGHSGWVWSAASSPDGKLARLERFRGLTVFDLEVPLAEGLTDANLRDEAVVD